jgi:rhodanese-related sulfurtransferase/DNA-directed RNA polymerase subunit RPC12/RpoP
MKLVLLTLILISAVLFSASSSNQIVYKCLPCGQSCDEKTYTSPSTCEHCNMKLVDASTINFKSIEPSEICAYLKNHPQTVLLDVRTEKEFEGKAHPDFGTLKNALNIPIQQLENRASEIDSLKDREIIVYCSHSHRSPQASYLLSQKGFKNIINLNGGMSVMHDNECKK